MTSGEDEVSAYARIRSEIVGVQKEITGYAPPLYREACRVINEKYGMGYGDVLMPQVHLDRLREVLGLLRTHEGTTATV